NILLTTATDVWALRYPDTHALLVLERAAGGSDGPPRHLDAASREGTLRVRSGQLAALPSVVLATEAMDENPAWRSLQPGELLHVGPDLRVDSRIVLDEPPAHPLRLSDLGQRAAASQSAAAHATGAVGGAR